MWVSVHRLLLFGFIYLFVRLFIFFSRFIRESKGLAAALHLFDKSIYNLLFQCPLHSQTKTDRLETSHLISTGSTALTAASNYAFHRRSQVLFHGGEKANLLGGLVQYIFPFHLREGK